MVVDFMASFLFFVVEQSNLTPGIPEVRLTLNEATSRQGTRTKSLIKGELERSQKQSLVGIRLRVKVTSKVGF
jgi:hypothetical protein